MKIYSVQSTKNDMSRRFLELLNEIHKYHFNGGDWGMAQAVIHQLLKKQKYTSWRELESKIQKFRILPKREMFLSR